MTVDNSPVSISTLDDDIASLSARIAQRLGSAPVIAWVEDSVVYCAPLEATSRAVDGDIVGSYSPGESVSAIRDDFRALLRERSRDDLLG